MNIRPIAAAAAITTLVTVVGVLAFRAAANPPRPAAAHAIAPRTSLANLKGLRVVLVLRDDWMGVTAAGAPQPGANAFALAPGRLFCRVDDVHDGWIEVSTPRSADPQVNPTTARDIWLIRTDAIVAIQTGEAER
ncbi:MAG TPA: hypothetical protein VHN77_10945 [Phycisphaerales bacterium]|nr:hypothetical protein [Phycisphaerales bacterium]